MLRKFAAGLLATALIAGPAFAQTSTSSMPSGTAPNAAAPASQNQAAPAKVTTAPASTMAAPAVTKTKQTANPSKTIKHAKLHKKTVKHVASRSHLKSGKVHQVRHVKSAKTQARVAHQSKAATAANRS
jgi:hypothetical protein